MQTGLAVLASASLVVIIVMQTGLAVASGEFICKHPKKPGEASGGWGQQPKKKATGWGQNYKN